MGSLQLCIWKNYIEHENATERAAGTLQWMTQGWQVQAKKNQSTSLTMGCDEQTWYQEAIRGMYGGGELAVTIVCIWGMTSSNDIILKVPRDFSHSGFN